MIDLRLKPAAAQRFNDFLDRFAPQYDKQAAALEMIEAMAESYMKDESLGWEVRALHTTTGRPEIFTLSCDEVIKEDRLADD
jgi:hypothetical protein